MSAVKPQFSPFRAVLSRRKFLKSVGSFGLVACFPGFSFKALDEIYLQEKSLVLFNPRTKESFEGIYYRHGGYVTDALNKIHHIMRDIRTGEVKPIDKNLLNLISAISIKLNAKKPLHIISGYRSPGTNKLLRKKGTGAAKNSFHLKGQAADIRLPGYKTSVLRKAAYECKSGGVGYYPKSRFVHIDIGPVRYWRG